MVFYWFLLAAVLMIGAAVAVLARRVLRLELQQKTAQEALNGVKQAAEDYPRISNEVRDMRETLEALPMDELLAQAEYDRAFSDGLESISGYSVEVAMNKGGGRS